MPKISIITINYNNADGLKKTIESVVSQSFSDFEYIVIDGASTDNSLDIIKKYASKITRWVSEKDNGIYNAQNKGISFAKGEYCLFLNSGDFLYDNKVLEKVFSKNYTEDIIYGDMIVDYGSGKTVYGKQPNKITFEFLIHTTLWHPVSFIKRKLFDKYGKYNEEYKIISDYEFFVRTILLENVTTRHIRLAISIFNTAGIGSSPEHEATHQLERKMVQEKYFSKEKIERVKLFYTNRKRKQLAISNWFKRHPFWKKNAIFFLNLTKKLKLFL